MDTSRPWAVTDAQLAFKGVLENVGEKLFGVVLGTLFWEI